MESSVGRARRRVLLGGAALSLGLFLWMAGLAAQQHSFSLDTSARWAVGLAHDKLLDAPMQMLAVLGEASGLVPLIALTSLLLWLWDRGRWALALPGVMTGCGALQLLAKWAVNRPRPNHTPWGFPSGHVLTLVVFFGLVAYLLCESQMDQSWRVLGGTFSAGAVLVVAFSRLYLDVHWLSDVVGGFMLGLAYLLLTIWSVECLAHRRPRRATVPFLSAPVPLPVREWAAEAVDAPETSQAATSA